MNETLKKTLIDYKLKQELKQSKKLLQLQTELKYLENIYNNIESYFIDNHAEEKEVLKKDIKKIKKEINFIYKINYYNLT